MAKQFLDADVSDVKTAIAQQDGTALTLTNTVRVLYDDAVSTGELYTAMNRIRDRIMELEQ